MLYDELTLTLTHITPHAARLARVALSAPSGSALRAAAYGGLRRLARRPTTPLALYGALLLGAVGHPGALRALAGGPR